MKKIKIGIPRSMLYYRYGVLWKNFFEGLGLNVVLSPETNQHIITLGNKNNNLENCTALKIYNGHVIFLSKICDYVLVSKNCDYGPKSKICQKINDNYYYLKLLLDQNQIIDFDIKYFTGKFKFINLFKLGFKFTKNPIKIIVSYILAYKKQNIYNQTKMNEQKNKIQKRSLKVLLVSNFYNLEDKYLLKNIIKYLKLANIIPIYSNNLETKVATAFSEYYPNEINYKYYKEMLGGLYYYINQVNGIIFISSYNCYIDNQVENSLSEIKDIPILNIKTNEFNNLDTNIETFIDIISKKVQ